MVSMIVVCYLVLSRIIGFAYWKTTGKMVDLHLLNIISMVVSWYFSANNLIGTKARDELTIKNGNYHSSLICIVWKLDLFCNHLTPGKHSNCVIIVIDAGVLTRIDDLTRLLISKRVEGLVGLINGSLYHHMVMSC